MRKGLFLSYSYDRKAWIFLYMFSLLLLNGIFLIDDGIVVYAPSILYINLLYLVLFSLFFGWRFIVETRYIRQLGQMVEEGQMVIDGLPTARNYQEVQYDRLLREVLSRQAEQVRQAKADNVMEQDYIASWVHEVKAPLTAMKLLIDDGKHDRVMRKMEMEWLRIHLLLDQQLSMTRLPTLQSDYLVQDVRLSKMVAKEVKELASWCLEKQIAVVFEGEEEETAVTDEKWAGFILRQLLTNAIKYSPKGGTVTVRFELVADRFKRIVIMDEGRGIAAHDQPRVFEKGYTGSAGRLHNAATGLGLYLAKQVADRLDIHLTLESIEGQGTTVRMTFPTENTFDDL